MASCSSSSFFFGEFFWIFFFYFQFRFSQVHFWPKRAGYLVHFIDLRYFIVGDVDHVAKSSLANANCQLPGSCWSHNLGLRPRLGLEVRKKPKSCSLYTSLLLLTLNVFLTQQGSARILPYFWCSFDCLKAWLVFLNRFFVS